MKTWILILMIFISVTTVQAAGDYTATVNNIIYHIDLVQMPFGPGEMGWATITLNNQVLEVYPYQIDDDNTIFITGLGIFVPNSGGYGFYQPTNIEMVEVTNGSVAH